MHALLALLAALAPHAVSPSVHPVVGGVHDVFVVRFVAHDPTGRSGVTQRSYEVSAVAVKPASGCVNTRRPFAPGGLRAGDRARVVLRAAGGGEGTRWCHGRFRGTVRYITGPACDTGRPCPKFATRETVVGRFSFRVR